MIASKKIGSCFLLPLLLAAIVATPGRVFCFDLGGAGRLEAMSPVGCAERAEHLVDHDHAGDSAASAVLHAADQHQAPCQDVAALSAWRLSKNQVVTLIFYPVYIADTNSGSSFATVKQPQSFLKAPQFQPPQKIAHSVNLRI